MKRRVWPLLVLLGRVREKETGIEKVAEWYEKVVGAKVILPALPSQSAEEWMGNVVLEQQKRGENGSLLGDHDGKEGKEVNGRKYDEVVFHVFGRDGFVSYVDGLKLLHNEIECKDVLNKFGATILDSCPPSFHPSPNNGINTSVSSSPSLLNSRSLLSPNTNGNIVHTINNNNSNSHKLQHHQEEEDKEAKAAYEYFTSIRANEERCIPCLPPHQFLYGFNDKEVSHLHIQQTMRKIRSNGATICGYRFEGSEHCSHFFQQEKGYKDNVLRFLSGMGCR